MTAGSPPKMIRLFSLVLLAGACLSSSCDAYMLWEKYQNVCDGHPIIKRKHESTLKWLVNNVGSASLEMKTSPQHEAACWSFRENKKFTPQRFVLGVLYYATVGVKWEINTDWVTSKHECTWYGVTCNYWKTVNALDLGFIKVNGLLPRELGLLKGLKELDLHGNDLQGVIPHKIMAGLGKLQYLKLHMNGMFGSIHREITHMKSLRELHLFGNYMGGSLPTELASLKKLGKENLIISSKEIKRKINAPAHTFCERREKRALLLGLSTPTLLID
jgi:hypothetical protein